MEAPDKKWYLAIGLFEATALVTGFLGAALLPGNLPRCAPNQSLHWRIGQLMWVSPAMLADSHVL